MSLEEHLALVADISLGDEIIALDGFRVMLTTFRRDEPREVGITLRQRPNNRVEITPMATTTPEKRAVYEGWLNAA